MKDEKNGVLLLNFGAPERMDEIKPFVTHICHGHKPTDQALKVIKDRYAKIGGGSPLAATTRAQAKGLEQELKRQGKGFPVYVGMLHSPPFIFDVVEKMVDEGVKNILALSLAPFYSEVSSGAYYAQVKKSLECYSSYIRVSFGADWYSHPSFISSWRKKIYDSLHEYPHPEEVNIVFTTHSLPMDHIEDALGYQGQYQAAVGAVMSRLPHNKFSMAYQSKGHRQGTWLSPQVEEVIEKLSSQGENSVLVVPMGFVADHLETMYDLDIETKKQAELSNMDFRRISALNDDPLFIKFLAELVLAME